MTNTLNLVGQTLSQLNQNSGNLKTAGEAKFRAQAIQQQSTVEERKGLTRLNKALESEMPLNVNAPRGYYLNIRV